MLSRLSPLNCRRFAPSSQLRPTPDTGVPTICHVHGGGSPCLPCFRVNPCSSVGGMSPLPVVFCQWSGKVHASFLALPLAVLFSAMVRRVSPPLHFTLCTLHPTPYILHPAPYTQKNHPRSHFYLVMSKKCCIFAPVFSPCHGNMSFGWVNADI